MNYKVITLTTSVLMSIASIAQVVSFTAGTPFKLDVNEKEKWSSIKHNDKIHFIQSTKGIGASIKQSICGLDGSFEKEFAPKIDMGTFGNSHQIEDIFQFNDKLYVAVDHFSKQDTKHSFSVREVDATTGTVLAADNELLSFNAEKMTNKGDCKFAVSPNQMVIAVIGELPFEKQQPCKMKVIVYDNAFAKKSEQEIVLPGENKRYNLFYTYVNNNGIIFIVRVGEAKNGDTQLNVYQVDTKAGAEVKEYFVNVETPNKITSYNSAVNSKGELVIAGVTTLRQTFSAGEVKANALFYFYTSKLTEGITNFTALDAPVENLMARKIVFNGNTTYLISEQFKEERKPKNNSSGTLSTETDFIYTSKSNFVFGFSEEGVKKFYIELTRNIAGYNALQHMQTGVFVVNDKLTLVYSDERNRKDLNYHSNPYTHTVAQITNDGLLQTPVQLDSKAGLDDYYVFYPGLSVLNNQNQIKVLTKNIRTGKAHVAEIKVN